jgi:nudix-type nucleoside diphosphatase (YffH/AdpP family)
MTDAVLASRTLFQGWMDFLMLKLRLGEQELERPLVRHPSGSSVLAYDPDRKVALVARQARYAVLFIGGHRLAEALGGVTDEGESPAETARREAFEEAGVQLAEVELVGHVWMTPSSTTERVHLFLASYGRTDRVAEGGGVIDEAENIELREEPLGHLWDEINSGAVHDAKLFMLMQALRNRRPELFV